MAFDPDAYLKKYSSNSGFDPDAYLAKYSTEQAQPEDKSKGILERLKNHMTDLFDFVTQPTTTLAAKATEPFIENPKKAISEDINAAPATLSAAGGLIGAMGGPIGPLTAPLGAAIGGAAGASIKQLGRRLEGQTPVTPASFQPVPIPFTPSVNIPGMPAQPGNPLETALKYGPIPGLKQAFSQSPEAQNIGKEALSGAYSFAAPELAIKGASKVGEASKSILAPIIDALIASKGGGEVALDNPEVTKAGYFTADKVKQFASDLGERLKTYQDQVKQSWTKALNIADAKSPEGRVDVLDAQKAIEEAKTSFGVKPDLKIKKTGGGLNSPVNDPFLYSSKPSFEKDVFGVPIKTGEVVSNPQNYIPQTGGRISATKQTSTEISKLAEIENKFQEISAQKGSYGENVGKPKLTLPEIVSLRQEAQAAVNYKLQEPSFDNSKFIALREKFDNLIHDNYSDFKPQDAAYKKAIETASFVKQKFGVQGLVEGTEAPEKAAEKTEAFIKNIGNKKSTELQKLKEVDDTLSKAASDVAPKEHIAIKLNNGSIMSDPEAVSHSDMVTRLDKTNPGIFEQVQSTGFIGPDGKYHAGSVSGEVSKQQIAYFKKTGQHMPAEQAKQIRLEELKKNMPVIPGLMPEAAKLSAAGKFEPVFRPGLGRINPFMMPVYAASGPKAVGLGVRNLVGASRIAEATANPAYQISRIFKEKKKK